MTAKKLREVQQEIFRLKIEAELAIKGYASSGGIYATGLAGEGYAGGYRDALDDVISLLNGGIVTRRIR